MFRVLLLYHFLHAFTASWAAKFGAKGYHLAPIFKQPGFGALFRTNTGDTWRDVWDPSLGLFNISISYLKTLNAMLLLYLLLCSETYLWAYVFGSGHYYLSRPVAFEMLGAFLKFSVEGIGHNSSDPNLNNGFFYFFAELADEGLFYFLLSFRPSPLHCLFKGAVSLS